MTGASGNYAFAATVTMTTYTTVIHATGSTYSRHQRKLRRCGIRARNHHYGILWAHSRSQQNVVAGCTIVAAASGTNANVTGVNATSGVGTAIASVAPNDTGVTGTGGFGTVTAKIGETPTGVAGTSAAGTVGGQLSDTPLGSLAQAAREPPLRRLVVISAVLAAQVVSASSKRRRTALVVLDRCRTVGAQLRGFWNCGVGSLSTRMRQYRGVGGTGGVGLDVRFAANVSGVGQPALKACRA